MAPKGQFKTHCKRGHEFTPENTKYHKDKLSASGLHKICVTCEKARRTTDGRRAWKRKWHHSNKDSVRNTSYKSTYGITLEQYNQILESQDGKCPACGETDPTVASKRTKVFPIDHDHNCCPGTKSCGKCVRGILCMNCNRAMGLLQDNISILQNMITYLQKYQ